MSKKPALEVVLDELERMMKSYNQCGGVASLLDPMIDLVHLIEKIKLNSAEIVMVSDRINRIVKASRLRLPFDAAKLLSNLPNSEY